VIGKIREELVRFYRSFPLSIALLFVVAGVALWAYDYYGSSIFFTHVTRHFWPDWNAEDREAGSYLYWFGSAFPILVVFPTVVAWVVHRFDRERTVTYFGWGLGDWKMGVTVGGLFYLVMLPILASIAWQPGFQDYYPIYGDADRSVTMFLVYEASYFVYFAAWEYFFRGYLCFGLEKPLGMYVIFVQMLPFACMHFGKPDLEALSSIFGGIALGYLALRTRSYWYGVIVHGLTAVTLDVMVVAVKHWRGG
jgi:hypothetical protein